MDCPACGYDITIKHGKRRTRTTLYQKYKCKSCGHIFPGEKLE